MLGEREMAPSHLQKISQLGILIIDVSIGEWDFLASRFLACGIWTMNFQSELFWRKWQFFANSAFCLKNLNIFLGLCKSRMFNSCFGRIFEWTRMFYLYREDMCVAIETYSLYMVMVGLIRFRQVLATYRETISSELRYHGRTMCIYEFESHNYDYFAIIYLTHGELCFTVFPFCRNAMQYHITNFVYAQNSSLRIRNTKLVSEESGIIIAIAICNKCNKMTRASRSGRY